MKINNVTAIVTGANRGIGKSLVEALLNHGVRRVYACARNIDSMSVQKEKRLIPIQLDLSQPESIRKASREARDVTMLINNAGVLHSGDIFSVSEQHLTQNFDVNFHGLLNMTRAFEPVIQSNNGGAIVNILTLLSLASMPGFSAYNASKAAAWSAHLSMRASLKSKNIAVHGVFPGAVDTDMLAGVEIPKTSPQEVAEAILLGLEKDEEDIFPDNMSKDVYAAWCHDHKAVEAQFASM